MLAADRFYVYGHYTSDTGVLFYIGKGTNKRAFQFGLRDRNKYWSHVKEKHGVRVEILKKNLTEEEAYCHEKELIEQFRPKCNLADGGYGPIGVVRSAETKKKISEASKGKILSEETKKKISEGGKKAYADGVRVSNAGEKGKEMRIKSAIKNGIKPFSVYDAKTDELIGEWYIVAECARFLKIHRHSISFALSGRSGFGIGKAKKYKFKRSL